MWMLDGDLLMRKGLGDCSRDIEERVMAGLSCVDGHVWLCVARVRLLFLE